MTMSDFAHIGDLNAPIGSVPWCRAVHQHLRIHKKQVDREVSTLKYGLQEFKNDKRWRQLTTRYEKPFRSWKDYVTHPEPFGLGMPVEEAEAVIEARDDRRLLREVLAARNRAANAADEANQRKPGRPKTVDDEKSDVNVLRPDGNSESYAHRKLRKDALAIHARVLAGEITAHAGMIEAGFRKPGKSRRLTTLAKVLKLVPQLTNAERVELIEHLVP